MSFEYTNFYLSLMRYPNAEVTYFPFDRILKIGKAQFNKELLAAVQREKPDLVFFFMYSEELDRRTLEAMKKYTTTLAWFADDSWRFYSYSKFWARHFSAAVTTYSYMPEFYRRAGQPNVIRSQWAADTTIYAPRKQQVIKELPDVSFVGLWSEPRGKIVRFLHDKGINVTLFGNNWPTGRKASEAEMLELFSLSRINLGLNPPPGRWNKNGIGRLFFKPSVKNIVPDFHTISNFQSWLHLNVSQIKARHFQIPACGGLLITSAADDIATWYVPGKEIVLYDGMQDMVEKTKYYLAHEDERERIARAGYERTIQDHTYARRFEKIFKALGLS